MSGLITEWLSAHYIELAGAILGFAYIIFSIRQSLFTWPTGLATSLLYIVVFFNSRFYADMGLQFYYVFISIYGWYLWMRGNPADHATAITVSRTGRKSAILFAIASLILFVLIAYILLNHTDSPVPYMDAATTALSIVATYMLARKIIEHWLIWIVVDLVSAGLYAYKGLWPTTILFLVYTVMAFIGYNQWKKELKTGPA
jgi:nicotinamide mononucleotide transporter